MMNPVLRTQKNKLLFHYRWWTVALMLTLVLSGCAGSTTEERFFRLHDPLPPQRYPQPLFPGILLLETFQARGMLARERTLLYRDLARANETQFHSANLWEDLPAPMIQAAIFHCLDQSGLFMVVTRAHRSLRPHYSLTGIVENLEQHATNGKFSVLIRVHFTLTNDKTEQNILSGSYQATESVMNGQMEVLLPAFDRAMTQVCHLLINDLASR